MIFIFIGIIILIILEANRAIDSRKFVQETEPYFRFLMEDDYKFLLALRYGSDVDVDKVYSARVRNALIAFTAAFFVFLNNMNYLYFLLCFIIAYLIFKMPYQQLKGYYKRNLHHINLMLPYYLKSLEILIQHYTVPVALAKSIDTAPDVFKPGLRELVAKINAGDFTIDPYMDFAKEYPVRDSMRMMRLLYRLSLGSNENKQEQLLMFSRTVSSLQNKSREQKYKDRLENMEKRTMMMLGVTGGGIIVLLLFAMMSMMQI